MSLSSVAEDSALRLKGVPGASPRVAASTAATVAAREAAGGAQQEQAQAAGEAAADRTAGNSVGASALTQLVKYVPTETITVYLAVQAALGTITAPQGKAVCAADFRWRWLWLVILGITTVLLAIGLGYRSQKQLDPSGPFKWPVVEPVAAVAAFLVWALSLSTTPLKDLCGYNAEAWSPVLLLVGTTAIATVIFVFGKTVSWQKILQEEG